MKNRTRGRKRKLTALILAAVMVVSAASAGVLSIGTAFGAGEDDAEESVSTADGGVSLQQQRRLLSF